MLDSVRCWSGGGPQNEVWNWGDAISPTLFRYVAGKDPEIIDYKTLDAAPHLMICGSTMKWATETSVLWGIGEIREGMRFVKGDIKPLRVAAVRGPLTRRRLLDANIPCPEIYGDPALLFPKYYAPEIQKRYALGFIPHYIDQNAPALAAFVDEPAVNIIDITQAGRTEKVHAFIDDVLSCQRIVSSSLHGLIIAEAYGIPALWMELSDKVFGGGFKFRDYFLSVRRNPEQHAPLRALPDAARLMALVDDHYADYGPIDFDAEPLLHAFPRSL
jgi:pyruvyltransferase